MTDIKTKLRELAENRGVSLSNISEKIGCRSGYVSDKLGKRGSPSFEDVCKICNVLNTTPNELIGIRSSITLKSDQSENNEKLRDIEKKIGLIAENAIRELPPTIDQIMHWWWCQRGELGNFDALAHHVTLFHPPEENLSRPLPHFIGRKSITSKVLNAKSSNELSQVLSRLNSELLKEIAISHKETKTRGQPIATIQNIQLDIPEIGQRNYTYTRVNLPVHDTAGNNYVMTYCRPLGGEA
ncbi:MAG: helix-turn-helix transcriptional regulator [Hyphomicrobiales bacterium]